MSSKKIDIPIIKNGKDICRLIFTQFDDGLFDIKINARENSFRVQTYSLFSTRPMEVYPDNLKDYKEHEITYHHGAENKPIVVHIKNMMPQDSEKRYGDLPLSHIQAPNINNDFPLPILKLEIPSNIVNDAPQYFKKNRHHPVNIYNSNVVEVFMMSDTVNLANIEEKYNRIFFLQSMMSMEYFCTNTILSGSQKMHTYIPSKPESRCTIVNGLDGMAVMLNYYPEPSLDKRRKSMYFTFIENEYAEDILMNTIIVYPEADENGCFPSLFVGGATIRDLSILTGINKKERIEDAFGKMKNCDGSMSGRLRYTAAQATVCMDSLTIKEKAAIIKKALLSAERLYKLSVEKEREKSQTRRLLFEKSEKFRRVLLKLQKDAQQRLQNSDNSISGDPVLWWLLGNSEYMEEQSYLMLSKYLQLDDCRMGCCQINEKTHWWLLYDDNWNVDIFNEQLNQYLNPGENHHYEKAVVTLGLDPIYTTPNIPGDTSFIRDNCTMTPLGYKRFDGRHREQAFEETDQLLEKVYYKIIEEINYDKKS